MNASPEILRYAAFSDDPGGGNPAGVVLDASALDEADMQRIAAEVDYAETAFITGEREGARVVRYFSPVAEVPFCGHATVATAVAIAEREGVGTIRFATPVGEVVIETSEADGAVRGAFTSVATDTAPIAEPVLQAVLDLIGLERDALDERYAPLLSYAGNWHPVIVLRDGAAFDAFTFDPAAARALLDAQGWPATITVLHRLADAAGNAATATAGAGSGAAAGADALDFGDRGLRFEARNIFPVGRITEDPATGAAAAAVGGYLRAIGAVTPPERVVIEQGRHVGRPGELVVDIPERGGIVVSGRAVPIG